MNGRHELLPARTVCSAANESPRKYSRRDLGRLIQAAALSAAVLGDVKRADAMSGLKIFPLTEPLGNSYYLMRAAESVSDARGVAKSNPAEMLSVHVHGLTPRGVKQTVAAANALKRMDVEYDAWIWPSISTNCMETAEVLANELMIRRERIVPEFSFLDSRGLGTLDGKPQAVVRDQLAAWDKKDVYKRPEPAEDGTPNDSASDVFIRVRQLLSKLETQYFGERIVLIAPGSDPLTVLQCALMDKDLHEHQAFHFAPGEIRRVQEKYKDPISGQGSKPVAETLSKGKV